MENVEWRMEKGKMKSSEYRSFGGVQVRMIPILKHDCGNFDPLPFEFC
jgi:hypothetical protein